MPVALLLTPAFSAAARLSFSVRSFAFVHFQLRFLFLFGSRHGGNSPFFSKAGMIVNSPKAVRKCAKPGAKPRFFR